MILIGRILFWIGWPFWFFYFKVSNRRTRVLIVCDNKALIVLGWLSSGRWNLPGGGAKRRESSEAAVIREVNEETKIEISESELIPIGEFNNHRLGLRYRSVIFACELKELPELTLQPFEILKSEWIDLNDIDKFNIDDDIAYALLHYRRQI